MIRITSTAVYGSELHFVHGIIPNMPHDFMIGHEAMGIVEESEKRDPSHCPFSLR
jgi:S-(hydroxymethyl)glutathione dehydrogenase / alcohol dehydrogenase